MQRVAEVSEVERAVGALIAHKDVDAYLENTSAHLKIEIRNSPLRDLPGEERHAKAFQIAQLAFKTYASRSALEDVVVVFVVEKEEGSTRYYNALAVDAFPAASLQGASAGATP
jgi:hypothetical protein